MKEEVGFNQFCDRFAQMSRDNNFSYEGKKALFDYLESYEEDTQTEIELDIIALCCEYVEYTNIDEYLKDYSSLLERKDFDTNEDFKEAVLQEISEKTTLIKINEDAFIIGCY